MDLRSFRAHQLPSLSSFLSSTSQNRKSIRVRLLPIPALRSLLLLASKTQGLRNPRALSTSVYFATMKEHLDSDRVNFLIWRYLLEGSTCLIYLSRRSPYLVTARVRAVGWTAVLPAICAQGEKETGEGLWYVN
ncbi:hypothetical protein F4825DRAFT_70959 [Nemania diffusa]|nr:hypothetical protein F4825DRAFT_70959 [Nemania diffusa]